MKKRSFLIILLLVLFTTVDAQRPYIPLNQSDSLAFINLYEKTNGLNWTVQIDFTKPAGEWPFIEKKETRIIAINLENNNLSGNLAATSIGKFSALERINLSNNLLSGLLPSAIGNLSNLTELLLSHNLFRGNIPASFGNLQQLVTLKIDYNQLDGKIPAAFFTKLGNLQVINLERNQLQGWLPSSIGSATRLAIANFAYNHFTGKIPPGINTLRYLANFHAEYNQLYGSDYIGRLCQIFETDLRGNHFNFNVLECMGGSNYKYIDPQQTVPLVQEDSFVLRVTMGGGDFSERIYRWYRDNSDTPYRVDVKKIWEPGKVSRLNILESGTYWVTGESSRLPGFLLYSDTITISNVSTLLKKDSLTLVDLFNKTKGVNWVRKSNWLTNAPLSTWQGVEVSNGRVSNLYLGNNNLQGNLPGTMKYLSGLRNIDLSQNQLTGPLPDLAAAIRLETVKLNHNKFSWILPKKWNKHIYLTNLDLSYNQLSGSIPENFGALVDLKYLNLSYNKLSGVIPEKVAQLALSEGRFEHNQLTGPVPPSFCSGNSLINIEYNYFNFDGMECFGDDGRISYNHQAVLPVSNQDGIFSIAAGGDIANNVYKWYLNGGLISTRSADSTFLPNMPGNYYVAITNAQVPELVLHTDTVGYTFPGSRSSDSLALVDFYHQITSGLNWVLTDPITTWDGITTIGDRVERIELTGLTGKLSTALGNLSALKVLQLYNGNITDSIPQSFTRLTLLTDLYLELKGETGSIPDDLGRYQPDLEWITLPSNQHTGPIPSGLRFTRRLIGLNLVNNRLTGTIPDFFKDISIQSLGLSLNRLTGNIPDTLSANISGVELAHNQLTGTIPPWLGTRNLGLIDLANNQLTGSLPDSMSYKWKIVRLQHNQLSGTIPEITGMPVEIDLSFNNFSAVSPAFCATNFKLPDIIDLRNNKLNFSNLECTSTNPYLSHISISPQQPLNFVDNNPLLKVPAGGTPANNTFKWYKDDTLIATITGDSTYHTSPPGTYHAVVTNTQLPDLTLFTDTLFLVNKDSLAQDSLALVEISKHLRFQAYWNYSEPISGWDGVTVENGRVKQLYLYLANGSISPAIGNLTAIRSIDIYGDPEYGNIITGPLPTTLGNLPLLETLSIEMFSEGGPIPDDLGKNQPHLWYVRLPANNHTGPIPSGLRYAQKLEVLSLADNKLTGTIPDFFKDKEMSTIDLYGNNLSGNIPDTLSKRTRMGIVNFGNNKNLTGEISPWLANTEVAFVDLSKNQFTGRLPDSMSFKWGAILMDNNQFSGPLPAMKGTESGWYTVSHNNLDAIPPSLCEVTFTRDDYWADMTYNRFTFTNLECMPPRTAARTILQPQQNILLSREGDLLKAPAGGTVAYNTYKWYRGNTLVATITGDSTFAVVEPGNYHANVANSKVPTLTLSSDTVLISSLSSRKSVDIKEAIHNTITLPVRIYPNPSSTVIYIDGLTSAAFIVMQDASGKTVRQWKGVHSQRSLDISTLSKGTYFIKVQQDASIVTLKFVKQ